MKNALFVLSGNCRTFIDCIDNMCVNLFSKLFSEDVNIYIYLYLKLTDPGPKGQDGWNFEYKNNDYNTILDKIYNIKSKYPKYNIDYTLLHDNNISDSELISQIKDRSLYIGYYVRDSILLRGLHCHYNLERCGNYILEKETSIQCKFDYIIYVRPDLFFTNCCNNIETYNTSIITLGEGPNVYNNDHIAIVPRQHLNAFFFDRMSVYRNNTNKSFSSPEEVYWHTITYEVKAVGKYFIKRP
jgi:hypothetical protein